MLRRVSAQIFAGSKQTYWILFANLLSYEWLCLRVLLCSIDRPVKTISRPYEPAQHHPSEDQHPEASSIQCAHAFKANQNLEEGYAYRSIEDVLNRLAPLLARHHLCVLPRVLDRESIDRKDEKGSPLAGVTLKVAYDLVSTENASSHVVGAYGEAHDDGDKATAKAMSAAHKSAMLQTFCIPVGEAKDADFPKKKAASASAGHQPEPVQGWEEWLRGHHGHA